MARSECFRRAARRNLPVDEKHGLVSDAKAARDVVRDDDARDTEALAHLLDEIVDHSARKRVEAARWLVINEDRRLEHERTRQAYTLAHTAGKFRGEFVRHRRWIETENFELVDDALLDLFACELGVFDEREGNVVHHVDGVEQGCVLVNHSEFFANTIEGSFVQSRNVFAIDENLSARWLVERNDEPQKRCFAGARAANDHRRFAAPRDQIDSAQNLLLAKGFAHVSQDNQLVVVRHVRVFVPPGRSSVSSRAKRFGS